MKEPIIQINGRQCTLAQTMTIHVAIENFNMDLKANSLGDDEHGKTIKANYLARLKEIRNLILK